MNTLNSDDIAISSSFSLSSKCKLRPVSHALAVLGIIVTGTWAAQANAVIQVPACNLNDDFYSVTANGSIVVGTGYNVLVNDNANSLTVVSITATSGGGTAAVASNGSLTYTPPASYIAQDTFVYTTDPSLCSGKNNAMVTIDISPVVVNDNFSTPFNTPLLVSGTGVNLVSNDFLPTEGFSLACPATTVQGGTLSNCSVDGSFAYTPPTGFSGTDTFTYEAFVFSKESTLSANVAITVGGNLPPIANNDGPFALAFGANYVGPASGPTNILSNDTDPENQPLSVSGNTQPARGSVGNVASDGTFTYTPNSGISGTDSFSYNISDGNGGTANAVVSFLIAPKATNDSYSTPFNTPLVVPLGTGVLQNDGGSSLTVLANTPPAHGSVNVATNGSFTYTPVTGYSGPDAFTYTLKDQANTNATATVNINVGVAPLAFGFIDSTGAITDTPSSGRGAIQRTIVSTPFPQPLTVKVLQGGLPIAGQRMCFALNPAGNGASATLSATSALTGGDGVASITATANGIVGNYTVTVTLCPVVAGSQSDSLKAAAGGSLVISLANDPANVAVPGIVGWLTTLLAGLLALVGVAVGGKRRR